MVSLTNTALALANYRRFRSLLRTAGPIDRPVWVLVPARDEATRIAAIIGDLRAQIGVDDLRVRICDDDSTDGTGTVATAAIAGDPRFELLTNRQSPPPGWTGKTHVLNLLTADIDTSGEHTGSDATAENITVMFVDADVRLRPHAVARAAQTSGRVGGLLTVWPAQVAQSPLEQLVQPLLCWSFLGSVPLAVSEKLRPRSMAVANGQFLVSSVADYRRAGGHRAVRADITEDLALARRYRDAGLSSSVRAGSDVASCRMYEGTADTWQGYRRWLGTEFGGPAGAVVVAAVMGTAYLLPWWQLITGRRRTRAAVAVAAATTSRLVARRAETGTTTAADLLSALAHPVAVSVGITALADSLRSRRRGTLAWKGRTLTTGE
ncbi:UNVERIFIED_CONTAM: glycosyl transferase family 2 [Williamsia faeni]